MDAADWERRLELLWASIELEGGCRGSVGAAR